MKPLCIVDLDGTVLDCSERHHRCYSAIAGASGRRPWSRPDYWRMKREGRHLDRILDSDDPALLQGCREQWRRCIESPEMLALDRPYEGVVGTLRAWRKRGLLVLATMRRDGDATRAQLRDLGLFELFDQIIVTHGRDKATVVAERLAFGYANLTWIGDSEADLRAGEALGARVCLVTNGIRGKDWLRGHGAAPSQLYPSLCAIDPFFHPWQGPPGYAPLLNEPGAPL